MAILTVEINTAINAETLERDYQKSTSAKYSVCQGIATLIQSILSGNQHNPSITVSIPQDAAQASGTFTFASIAAGNTLTINGVVFTAESSGAGANQFNIGSSDTEAAANAAASINASASPLVNEFVTATSALGVITVTAINPGVEGNDVTITGGTHVTASGVRLTGGTNDAGAVTYTF